MSMKPLGLEYFLGIGGHNLHYLCLDALDYRQALEANSIPCLHAFCLHELLLVVFHKARIVCSSIPGATPNTLLRTAPVQPSSLVPTCSSSNQTAVVRSAVSWPKLATWNNISERKDTGQPKRDFLSFCGRSE